MHLPNFLIIGAAKCGTTSLAEYLEQHPEIFFCPWKEPNYFALAGAKIPKPGPASPTVLRELLYPATTTDFTEYQALFDRVGGERAIGEASVRNIYYPEAPVRIKKHVPNARIVAVLREPVSRLYSHYCMNTQFQLEPMTLLEAIAAESDRRAAGWGYDWHYVNVGFYGQQLRRYFELFARDQIKVFLYEDFVERPLEVYQEICRHVAVSPDFVPDMSRRGKPAYRPRHLGLDRWLHWPRRIRPGVGRLIPRLLPKAWVGRLEKWNSAPIPPLKREIRDDLATLFRNDVMELEDLIGRKTGWYA